MKIARRVVVYGNKSDKVYDDWEGVEELVSLPDHAFHRNVDSLF